MEGKEKVVSLRPWKATKRTGKSRTALPLMEAFTPYKERATTRSAAYFIRIGGCDVDVIGAMLRRVGMQKNTHPPKLIK